DILNCGYQIVRARWDRTLRDEIAKGQWAPVPPVAVALPAPPRQPVDRAEMERCMSALGAGDLVNRTRSDPKAWARKILDNPKAYTVQAVKNARESLGKG